jgi:GPH family glycoside/pentoside/hexuronide:cation symporter
MDNQGSQATPRTRWRNIIGYSMGNGALSLTLNGIYTYAMLYYTQARGLSFAKAGVAFAVASLWDAIVDPAIGHISDNTRTRWGRRHPYILFG